MKLYTKHNRGHRRSAVVKAIHHSERSAARIFCRRWLRGQEGE